MLDKLNFLSLRLARDFSDTEHCIKTVPALERMSLKKSVELSQ